MHEMYDVILVKLFSDTMLVVPLHVMIGKCYNL